MSIAAINWVFKLTVTLSSSERLLLFVLAHCHHTKTGRIFPSNATLAEKSGLSERRVQMNMRKLEKKNLVVVKARGASGLQLSNEYHLAGVTGGAHRSGVTGGAHDRESLLPYEVQAETGDFLAKKKMERIPSSSSVGSPSGETTRALPSEEKHHGA